MTSAANWWYKIFFFVKRLRDRVAEKAREVVWWLTTWRLRTYTGWAAFVRNGQTCRFGIYFFPFFYFVINLLMDFKILLWLNLIKKCLRLRHTSSFLINLFIFLIYASFKTNAYFFKIECWKNDPTKYLQNTSKMKECPSVYGTSKRVYGENGLRNLLYQKHSIT